MAITILRLPEVINRTGLSSSTIYRLIEQGRFPIQVKISARNVGWIESEIEEYQSRTISSGRSNS